MGLFDDIGAFVNEIKDIGSELTSEFDGLKDDVLSSVDDIKTGATDKVNDAKQQLHSNAAKITGAGSVSDDNVAENQDKA